MPTTQKTPRRGTNPKTTKTSTFKATLTLTQKIFLTLLKSERIPTPEVEHQFDLREQGRKWRFDYAWPEYRVALEVEGGVWTGGRHTRGHGFVADIEKYNEAACQGWRLIRVVPQDLLTAKTMELIWKALQV